MIQFWLKYVQLGWNCQVVKGSQDENGKLEIGVSFYSTYRTSFFTKVEHVYKSLFFLLKKYEGQKTLFNFSPQKKKHHLVETATTKRFGSNPNAIQNPSDSVVGFAKIQWTGAKNHSFYPSNTFQISNQVGGWWWTSSIPNEQVFWWSSLNGGGRVFESQNFSARQKTTSLDGDDQPETILLAFPFRLFESPRMPPKMNQNSPDLLQPFTLRNDVSVVL